MTDAWLTGSIIEYPHNWNRSYRDAYVRWKRYKTILGLSGDYDLERYNYTLSQCGNRRANYSIGAVGYTSDESNPAQMSSTENTFGTPAGLNQYRELYRYTPYTGWHTPDKQITLREANDNTFANFALWYAKRVEPLAKVETETVPEQNKDGKETGV